MDEWGIFEAMYGPLQFPGAQYRSNGATDRFVNAIENSISLQFLDCLSRTEMVSISLDGSATIDKREMLVTSLKFVDEEMGQLKECFVALNTCMDGKGETVRL